MRAPLAPPRLSEPRKVEADAQAVAISALLDSPEFKIISLSALTFEGPNFFRPELGLAKLTLL